jgi:hypothetical protein
MKCRGLDGKMIEVTVTENGETLGRCEFDGDNLVRQVGGVSIVMRHAMVESRNAPIWQRVAHAATMVAWSEGALDDL